jgi:hypothetical protein
MPNRPNWIFRDSPCHETLYEHTEMSSSIRQDSVPSVSIRFSNGSAFRKEFSHKLFAKSNQIPQSKEMAPRRFCPGFGLHSYSAPGVGFGYVAVFDQRGRNAMFPLRASSIEASGCAQLNHRGFQALLWLSTDVRISPLIRLVLSKSSRFGLFKSGSLGRTRPQCLTLLQSKNLTMFL